jgi:hypothetical protein
LRGSTVNIQVCTANLQRSRPAAFLPDCFVFSFKKSTKKLQSFEVDFLRASAALRGSTVNIQVCTANLQRSRPAAFLPDCFVFPFKKSMKKLQSFEVDFLRASAALRGSTVNIQVCTANLQRSWPAAFLPDCFVFSLLTHQYQKADY